MSRNAIVYGLATSLIIGTSFWGGWDFLTQRQTADAWALQEPAEMLLGGVSSGQKVEVEFHLTNKSNRPLRILGGTAC
jgi:hypothetical protein